MNVEDLKFQENAPKTVELAENSPTKCLNMIPDNLTFCFRKIINSQNLKNLCCRKKSFNSTSWLERRKHDPYIEKTKKENYRCRSAFKLIEMDDRFKLIQPGFKVLDVGAAPGSWSQVLAKRTNSNGEDPKSPRGLVIAIDLSNIHILDGVVTLSHMDFTKESSQKKILEILQANKLDFVFSDMAPTATGIKNLDQENIIQLVYPVVVFAIQNLKQGGGCLIKIWDGQHEKLVDDIRKFFKSFRYVKPKASYDSSSENYLLARDFLGLKS